MIENKDIKFRVLYEDWGAANKMVAMDKAIDNTTKTVDRLSTVNRTSNQLLMSTGRIVQDLPYGFMGISNNITFLAEQFQSAKANGIGFRDALKGMLTSFTGVGGIVFAISTATSLLTIFGNKLFGLGSPTESAKKQIGSLRDEFASLKDEVNKVVGALNFNEVIMMGEKKSGLINLINATQTKLDMETRPNERTRISLQLAGYKSELEAITKEQEFQNFAFQKWLDMQKDSDKTIKNTKENLKEISKIITGFSADGKRMDLASGALGISYADIKSKQGGKTDKAGMATVTADFIEQAKFMREIVRDNLQIIRGEFSTLWQNVFGEANSLFEKLLMNFAGRLAERGIGSLFGSLLNFIFPGAGMALGAASPLGGGPQIINLQADNRTLATFYVTGKREAERLRF